MGYRPRRKKKKWSDAGSGPGSQDWTGFDLGRVLRVFRNADPNTCKLSLRKLHLRWWHAQAQSMMRLLEHAGVPKAVIDLIPDIVDTCVACRAWARPLPDAQASVELADTFNQQVENPVTTQAIYYGLFSNSYIENCQNCLHFWSHNASQNGPNTRQKITWIL